MFENSILQNHLENSSVVKTQSFITAEWNLNIPGNIDSVGNYRYRSADSTSPYQKLPYTFDPNDSGNYYTNATEADITIDGGYSDLDQPFSLTVQNEKIGLLYSLEDCLKPFRPRSGINKARYMPGQYLHHINQDMAKRPRYYMPDKDDNFKYWTSYRKEKNSINGKTEELGISFLDPTSNDYLIYDAAPYVIYKEAIPTNKIVIKMQTHAGSKNLGPFKLVDKTISDPLFGDSNKAVPVKWKIQYMINNSWIDAIRFDKNSTRLDGTPIIKSDGYVEIGYGLKIPSRYQDIFIHAETIRSITQLPSESIEGYAYLLLENDGQLGKYYIWTNGLYEEFYPSYCWSLQEEQVNSQTNFVTDFTSPSSYAGLSDSSKKYREFEYIQGIRVVAETMNKENAQLEIIEISPRLSADISDKVVNYSIKKNASDLGLSGLPVGQLLASSGTMTIFDYDNSFLENNKNSIISSYLNNHIQFKFYNATIDVKGTNYFVPIKTMYSDGFPKYDMENRKISIDMRDLYFYFESMTAPQILFKDASLSSAVSLLLDSIGFSNYVFKRIDSKPELTIPYFFIQPDVTVAEVLQKIAISTQTAMFFDEYNNFVMMTRDYMMASESERPAVITLSESKNILSVASQNTQVYNGGVINYDTRYVQRTYGSISQANLIDKEKTWIYKPVLLWEVAGTENTKSINSQVANQSTYMLSAIPLNSDLSNEVPSVVNHKITNNIIDFGEGIYWLSRNNGYFYSNGEIIKYDAAEYSVTTPIWYPSVNGVLDLKSPLIVPAGSSAPDGYEKGTNNVWISSTQDYQKYFASLPFNGKIYPTGKLRIYCEPKYETIDDGTGKLITRLKNGAVEKHGRAQFGTAIQNHYAGLNPYWSNNDNVRGCNMNSDYLFKNTLTPIDTVVGTAGVDNVTAQKSTRNGIIKNFMSSTFIREADIAAKKSVTSGTIQSSALVVNGPSFDTATNAINFISYVYKPLSDKFKHFGTRMRIVGKIENGTTKDQSPQGGVIYYTVPGITPDQNIGISGGSGGLGVLLNPLTNAGYYFEIVALGTNTITQTDNNVNNVLFYKIKKDASDTDGTKKAIPVPLWQGLTNITVDDGNFTGQYRMTTEQNPTVYDLAVEYMNIGKTRRFFLYINETLVATVDDLDPLPEYNNMGLFVRGSAKCMFENVYALTHNYSQNTSYALDTPAQSIYQTSEISSYDAFRKYAMSGMIQGTYLSSISPAQPPTYKLFFEEFGTIMREASIFKIKYDKAYPALYAKMSPTFNSLKGYTISGFRAGAYGAEFMVFNATDTALSLDETTGNYLRIQGVTFTQQSQNKLTVDDFFSKNSDFSNPKFEGDRLVSSPFKNTEIYDDIKISRLKYGKKEFSLDVPYVQTQDDANSLMEWVTNKVLKPRQSIGLKIFNTPTIQLGDIVKIDYHQDGVDVLGTEQKRYIVYSIEQGSSVAGPDMTIYVSEVV